MAQRTVVYSLASWYEAWRSGHQVLSRYVIDDVFMQPGVEPPQYPQIVDIGEGYLPLLFTAPPSRSPIRDEEWIMPQDFPIISDPPSIQ
jgi:hypothetical protein